MASPRTNDVLNRLELIAQKLKKTVEEVVDILEGKSDTHKVVLKTAPQVGTGNAATSAAKAPTTAPAPAPAEKATS